MSILDPWPWQNAESDFGENGKPIWPDGSNPNKPRAVAYFGAAGKTSINVPIFVATGIPILRRSE